MKKLCHNLKTALNFKTSFFSPLPTGTQIGSGHYCQEGGLYVMFSHPHSGKSRLWLSGVAAQTR